MEREENIHLGHRNRMREKFSAYGSGVFCTHELLEMLLYTVIPYKDTNRVAKNLLRKFGSLSGVLTAAREELLSVSGVGEKVADCILAVGEFSLQEHYDSRKDIRVYDDCNLLGEYFTEKLSDKKDYCVCVLMLDNSMRILGYTELYELDYSSGGVKAAPFVEFAIATGASVAVVAHSHPHGPLFPSAGDMATNNLIYDALMGIGVLLLDHYIICGKRYYAFMKSPKSSFSQKPSVARYFESKRSSSHEF